MKLSFSTQYQSLFPAEAFQLAEDTGVTSVELYCDISRPLPYDHPLQPSRVHTQRRELYLRHRTVPCIAASPDWGDPDAVRRVTELITAAQDLNVDCVVLRAEPGDMLTRALRSLLPTAERLKTAILLESRGAFADTDRLRLTLDAFASDYLGACWCLDETVQFGETPEQTITHLGAYVRHVHYTDFLKTKDGITPALTMEGDLPMDQIYNALRSVNYDGALSLVWNPAWLPDLPNPSVYLPHFAACLTPYTDTAGGDENVFWNRAHTGRYLWEKDSLIPMTFPRVLDAMV